MNVSFAVDSTVDSWAGIRVAKCLRVICDGEEQCTFLRIVKYEGLRVARGRSLHCVASRIPSRYVLSFPFLPFPLSFFSSATTTTMFNREYSLSFDISHLSTSTCTTWGIYNHNQYRNSFNSPAQQYCVVRMLCASSLYRSLPGHARLP